MCDVVCPTESLPERYIQDSIAIEAALLSSAGDTKAPSTDSISTMLGSRITVNSSSLFDTCKVRTSPNALANGLRNFFVSSTTLSCTSTVSLCKAAFTEDTLLNTLGMLPKLLLTIDTASRGLYINIFEASVTKGFRFL